MRQRATCTRCGSELRFSTDGMGRIIEQCLHCHDGWPLKAALPDRFTCVHGADPVDCGRCERSRQAIRDGIAEQLRKQNACKNGHLYTPENLRARADGRRACLTCYREGIRVGNAKKRARRAQRRAA